MMKYTQTSQHHFIIGAVRLREVEQFVFDLTASSWERRAVTPWLWTPYPYILLLLFLSSFVCVNFLLSFFFFFWSFLKILIWLCQVLVATHGTFSLWCGVWVFSCGMWDLVPQPEIELRAPALGAWSLYPLDYRESPYTYSLCHTMHCELFLSLGTKDQRLFI